MIRITSFASVLSATVVVIAALSVVGVTRDGGTRAAPAPEAAVVTSSQAFYREWAQQLFMADLRAADGYAVPKGVSVDTTELTAARGSATQLLGRPLNDTTVSLYRFSSALLDIAVANTKGEVRRAQAKAAAQAAARKRARAAALRAEAAHSAPTRFTLNVWTSSNKQSAIDACRGGVAWPGYPSPTVVEHWRCGGASFPRSAGAIVTVTGYHAGTYRVIGVVREFNASTWSPSVLPSGYQLLFQTCLNDNAHTTILIGLARVK